MWPQVALDMLGHAAPTSPLLRFQTWITVLHGVIFNRRAQERKVRKKAQLQPGEVISKLPKQELEDRTYHFRTNSVSLNLRSEKWPLSHSTGTGKIDDWKMSLEMSICGLKLAGCCTESFNFSRTGLVGSLENSPRGNLPVLISLERHLSTGSPLQSLTLTSWTALGAIPPHNLCAYSLTRWYSKLGGASCRELWGKTDSI